MKWKFKDTIIMRIIDNTMVLYDTSSGAYYGVRGALKQYFMEIDKFAETDIIDYLCKTFGVECVTASEDIAELFSDFKKSELIEPV